MTGEKDTALTDGLRMTGRWSSEIHRDDLSNASADVFSILLGLNDGIMMTRRRGRGIPAGVSLHVRPLAPVHLRLKCV